MFLLVLDFKSSTSTVLKLWLVTPLIFNITLTGIYIKICNSCQIADIN